AENINVIITSDHGMSNISDDRIVYLYDIIRKDWCKQIDGANPVFSIEAKDEYYDSVYYKLSTTEHISVWKKDEIPKRLNFGKSERVKDFVVVADSSWSLWESTNKISYVGGAHGYDNQNKDMHAIFYAYGPAFKNNFKHPAINNIDIYPLICKILKIDPCKADGKLENGIKMLNNKN
ncbi:MAG: alkaline phosphatase family protein, partial [Bacteroidales bacterium]|nr:alkaline phosphatase family protein [Bacteroidales bacterium]